MIVITTINALPDLCYECPCSDGENGYCQADKERRYSDYRPYWCPLKDVPNEEVEGHWIVHEYCAKDTKDVVDKVIENICRPSDDEPGVCRCAMKCQEHTNKNDLKEKESVKPICQIIFDVPYYFCGSCKTMLNMYATKAKYCSQCGRLVKWEWKS